MATKKKAANFADNVKVERVKRNMNQSEFWSRVGVTQSGGSRYESGRAIPAPTKTLLELVYLDSTAALALLATMRGAPSVKEMLVSAKLK